MMLGNSCPNCGYCSHCGRGGYHARPYYFDHLYRPWAAPYHTTGGWVQDSWSGDRINFQTQMQANGTSTTLEDYVKAQSGAPNV